MLTASHQRRKRPSLTPLIDVVFLLLIFFMIVSRLSVTQQTPLTLGKSANSSQSLKHEESITVEIQSDGNLLVDGTSISLGDFIKISQGKKDRPIIITLAQMVTFQQTIQTLETFHIEGFATAKLSTERPMQW